jgi:dihydroorotase
VVEALTIGPSRALGSNGRLGVVPGLEEGTVADVVVLDRAAPWRVDAASLASRARNTPLLGRELTGAVLLTVASGRLAFVAPEIDRV